MSKGRFRPPENLNRQSREQLVELLRKSDAALRRATSRMRVFRELAYCDPLTGLSNRRHFEERLHQEIARVSRCEGKEFSILVLDVNDFKAINDELGHQAGDDTLKQVAVYLEKQLRAYDVRCRTGGDEFMVILPSSSARDCARVMARLRRELGSVKVGDGRRLSLSIGAATWTGPESSAESMIHAADAAMYEDKRQQKGKPAELSRTVRPDPRPLALARMETASA